MLSAQGGRIGVAWTGLGTGTPATRFTNNPFKFNVGFGGAWSRTQISMEQDFSLGWDALGTGITAVSWAEALAAPSFRAAGE